MKTLAWRNGTARALMALAAAVLCGGLGCAGRRPTPVNAPAQDSLRGEVQALALQADALLRAQGERVWAHWTEGTPIELDRTYEMHPTLFGQGSLATLAKLQAQVQDPKEVRALTYLRVHFTSEALASQMGELNESLANLEASLSFRVGGKEHPYRELERALAHEGSSEGRAAIYRAATPSVARLSRFIRAREEKLEQGIRRLGYASYEAFGVELRMAQFDVLASLARQLLEATEAPYAQVLGEVTRRQLQIPADKLRRSDFPRLFRSEQLDASFPKQSAIARARSTLEGMRIDLFKMPGVTLDVRDVAAKRPRPLALGITVPGDVRFSIKPAAGAREQATVLYELGHALHFAYTRPMRFELAKLGSAPVGDAYAALFEGLMDDPAWLREQVGLSDEQIAERVATSAAQRMFLVRLAAGQLLYSLAMHRQANPDAKALHRQTVGRAYGVPVTEEDEGRCWIDLDELYAAADALRTSLLEAQLERQLKIRFGPSWWHNPEAGQFLKSLWAHGNALTPAELARAAGEEGLDIRPLLQQLGSALHVPIVPPPTRPPSAAAPSSPAAALGGGGG